MKSRILVTSQAVRGGWAGNAFGGHGVIAIAVALSEVELATNLRLSIQDYLATEGSAWLQEMQHADAPEVVNCPEGAIKLPIDLWVCKVVDQTCPIHAQVFVDAPERFLDGCLAPQARKQAILGAVSQGRYSGFHHTRGRYLCVRCADERGSESSFSYHYPWELSSLEDFAPFELMRDMAEVLPKLMSAGISRGSVGNALCADHSLEIAELLYPEIARELQVFEFNITRP